MATIIEMPKLSDTMSVGTVVKWHKKIGDTISNGDVLAEIETDKATMELECFDDGTLLKIFVGEGEEVPIGSPLAAVGEEGETVEDLPSATTGEEADEGVTTPSETASEKEENSDDSQPEDESGEAPATTGTVHGEEGGETSAKSSSSERIIASPLAKKIALEEKIDLSKITGTGPSGRITKKDVLSFAQAPGEKVAAAPSSDSQVKVASTRMEGDSFGNLKEQSVPVSKMRSIIASRLLESKSTIPHFYLQKEIDSQPLRLAREAMNERLANRCSPDEQPLKLTLNDIILKACAETIKWIPEINTSWEEKRFAFTETFTFRSGLP